MILNSIYQMTLTSKSSRQASGAEPGAAAAGKRDSLFGPKDIKAKATGGGADQQKQKQKHDSKMAKQQQQQETATAAAPSQPQESEEDKFAKFENEGVVFKAKLIGSELVMEPRGDKMCQNSIQRLKAIIKGTNSHKKRIVLKISFDGVKIYDEKSGEMLHHHEVAQISYIASDDTDTRTFGYVSDVPAKAHLFICFKTSGPAIAVMTVISSLFEATLEKKNRDKKAAREKEEAAAAAAAAAAVTAPTAGSAHHSQVSTAGGGLQESMDLIGDSGIVEGDASIITWPQTSSILDTFVAAPGPADSFNSFVAAPGPADSFNSFVAGPGPADSFNSFVARPGPADSFKSLVAPAGPADSFNSFVAPVRPAVSFNISANVPVSSAARPVNSQPPKQPILSAPNDNYMDRYSVFNDIDSLPSIFESILQGNGNKPVQPTKVTVAGGVAGAATQDKLTTSNSVPNMFRQRNPFDDDFFA